jgi:hypothetical protein
VLAHRTWWDQWLLAILPPWPDGDPSARPPLFEQIPTGTGWADELNARVYSYYRQRDLTSIQTAFDMARQQLLQRVQARTIDNLFNPHRLFAQIGRSVAPAGEIFHHPQLRSSVLHTASPCAAVCRGQQMLSHA